MAREMSAAVLSKDFPVFIDTNLDTHLAVVVSADDTVADLKRKVMLEHPLCFPEIGKIHIQAIKVRRRSSLYHLSDAMLVRSAFGGIKGTWYLHMDVNSTGLMKNHVESTDDVLRPDIGGALKESLVIEPAACNFPADIAGKSRSCVMNGSSVDEDLQRQPEPVTALVHHDDKLTLCDPFYRAPPASDDLHLPPQVASSDIENCQVPTEGQFGPINGYGEAPKDLKLGAKDSNVEFVSSSDVNKQSDYEVLKIQNSVCDENRVLEDHAPLKGSISEKERGIGCNVSSLSFVPIMREKSMNGSIDIQENTPEENLQGIPAAEKKRKREKKKENNAFTKTSENSLRSDATDATVAKGASESEYGNSKESSNKSWNDDCSAQKLNEAIRIKKSLEIHNDMDSESPDGSGLPAVPVPLPSVVHHSITSKETVAKIDADSVATIEMEDNTDCNVEMRNDNLVERVTIGDKKAKRLKKHCTNSASLPLLVAEDSTRNTTPLHGNVTLADDTIGIQLTVENNNPTSSSALLDLSTSNSMAAGIMDSVSDMEKADSGKVENKRDTQREAMVSGDKKAKKSRKHHVPSSKGLIPPLVEECNYSMGNITRLQQLAEVVESVTKNNVSCSDDIVGIRQNVESSYPASLSVPQGASMLKTAVADTAMDSTVIINSNEVNGTEAETGRNASAQAVAAGDKKARKLRKHRVASSRSLNPSSTEEHSGINEETISLHENVTIGDGSTDIHQFNESVKEVNALSKNAELKTMKLVANNSKNESLGLDEVESGNDAADSVILREASEIFETGDVKDRKRKKSKKTRIGGAKKHVEDAIPMNSDNGIITEDCGETKEVGDALSLQEPTEKPKTKNSNNQLPCPNEEADNVSREGPIPPNITPLSEVSTELGSEKGRRKLKTILASTAIGGSEPLMDRHIVGTVELTPPSPEHSAMDYLQKDVNQSDQSHKEENALPRKKKKERSRKMNSKDPLLESVSLGGKETNAREGDSQSDQSHREENALPRKKKKERSRKTNSKDLLSGSVSLGDKEANAKDRKSPVVGSLNEASDGKIDFKDAFVRGEKQREVVDPTEDVAAKDSPKKLSKEKTIRHKIKPDALSEEMLGLESHTGSNGHPESRKKAQDFNPNTVEIEGPPSQDKQGKHLLCSNGNFVVPSKRKKISRTSVSNAAVDGSSEQLFAVECAKENESTGDTSSASTDLEGTVSTRRGHRHISSPPNRYRVAVRKVPRKKVGEVLNNSETDKSQLVTQDSIFKHISSGSSQDDGEVHDSDATTISHSNDSSSPAYSDGEHDGIHSKTPSRKKHLNMDSPESGHGALSIHRQRSTEDGSDGIVLSQATDVKSRSFGTVLRSSSAYRKAKISLSQSRLDDFESQPEDVVPDSQAANLS